MPVASRHDPSAFAFREEFSVRDYECDMEGIVNNAVYQNYLEHARHQFLRAAGVDFAALVQEGIHLVVVRVEIDYVSPLRSGDRFWVGVWGERLSPLRGVFHQGIFAHPGDRPALRARVIGASLNAAHRPARCAALDLIFPQTA
ncbi:MAG: acyl-CoA thioesterase [Opitutales bacterium]|nr:acyl-CoA thioesterase [Opitutales bacterium]